MPLITQDVYFVSWYGYFNAWTAISQSTFNLSNAMFTFKILIKINVVFIKESNNCEAVGIDKLISLFMPHIF